MNLSDIPTPLTDAESARVRANCEELTEPISADFARDLERKNAVLREALNRMVAANSGVAVMPTKEAREENAALANARAALAATEEKK